MTGHINNPLVVNFLGGPGTGKSTTAATIFSMMKQKTFPVELVTEFARDLVYAGREHTLLNNQLYVLGKQYERMNRLIGKCNIIITDSPLILSSIYVRGKPDLDIPSFHQITLDVFNLFDNLNFFIRRSSSKEYITTGRVQETLEEATKFDDMIIDYMNNNQIPYIPTELGRDDFIYDCIKVRYAPININLSSKSDVYQIQDNRIRTLNGD